MAHQADPREQPQTGGSGDVLVRASPGEGEGKGENTSDSCEKVPDPEQRQVALLAFADYMSITCRLHADYMSITFKSDFLCRVPMSLGRGEVGSDLVLGPVIWSSGPEEEGEHEEELPAESR